MRHDGTVAIVTGAGHGIGREIALQLASEGAAIAVLEIDAERGRETIALLADAGARAIFVECDIAEYNQVEAAFAEAAEALGPVTLLVNNAAFTDAGSLEAISVESWHREIDINLNGAYHCTRAVIPAMRRRGSGAIVNIASVNGLRYFGNPAYSAAKAGLISLTQSVASEYGPVGIRCNAICPGSVRTDNVTWTIRQQKDPEVFNKLARWYPLGRVAEPRRGLEARGRTAIRLNQRLGELLQLFADGSKFGQFFGVFRLIPEANRDMRNREIVAQVQIERMQHRLEARRGNHRDTEPVHLLADGVVFLTKFEQLAHLAFKLPVLVAQAEHLALGDRDGSPAMRVRDHQT